jgi:transposase
MARRLAEGRTRKEVIRCLKLYVARQVHRAIITDLTARAADTIRPASIAA